MMDARIEDERSQKVSSKQNQTLMENSVNPAPFVSLGGGALSLSGHT